MDRTGNPASQSSLESSDPAEFVARYLFIRIFHRFDIGMEASTAYVRPAADDVHKSQHLPKPVDWENERKDAQEVNPIFPVTHVVTH